MKILAEDLSRLCYNAIQFSSKDSSLGGVVMFEATAFGDLFLYASDDYVAMKDQAKVEDVWDVESIWLGLKEVKEIEKSLRATTGPIEIELGREVDLLGPWGMSIPRVAEPPDFSGVVEVCASEVHPLSGELGAHAEPFAIRPERFAKFRLLRTPESPSCKDGYPVDFIWDGGLIRWKCGPFLRGALGPLARRSFVDQISGIEVTGIEDLYAEESEVLW